METREVEYAPDYKSNKFSDYLAQQLKDPEFAAAYNEVSAAEDKRLAELQRLEREVIEKAKAWNDLIGIPSDKLTLAECALAEAVDQLDRFESSQQQIKK